MDSLFTLATCENNFVHEYKERSELLIQKLSFGWYSFKTVSYLDKPDGYKGHVVGTEHRANQHLLHPPVEVHLQVLHLLADEIRGEAAGVSGHSLDAVQLAGVLLPRLLQHGQIVPAPAHAAHLLGADAGDGGERTRASEVTAQPEEGNIHPKSAENNSYCLLFTILKALGEHCKYSHMEGL